VAAVPIASQTRIKKIYIYGAEEMLLFGRRVMTHFDSYKF
jgi:hypothetical protein